MPPQFSCVPLRSTSENCAVLPCFSDFGYFPTAHFLTFPKYVTRVARCIDNDPMEGFRDILKRERYYGRRFTSKQDLIQMIERYIRYYPTRRVQRNLGVMTP